ncbi:YjjG family noncanonical pyrimidine nucleotidase [Cytobacillus purgationiresistens]|uniref:2-haloacid dehalogenase n=1 Tax=Cytobacillus purgationiresistens TaxID=863449 RepID=A0ABU0AK45_9BACI|nr:YjjG family noncanonical pyrimidine nucleotidase [Cytobacillus purgationiresistens]MDQ0271646.1 2-haloacid dehalogenase [Cytobacillus purgationiresistens]
MNQYQFLLFDIDDTLLDFRATEQLSLKMLFEQEKLDLTPDIEQHYRMYNQGLWRSFEEGKLGRTELLNTRFANFLKEYGKEVDGVLMEKSYRGFLEQGHHMIDGALDLINRLAPDYELYVVTNGVSKTQDRRLRDAGLHPLFKNIFVSDDTGYQKPMKEFFDYVFARIPNFSRDKGLIIGDSLLADMMGGKQAGLDTCWVNPEMKPDNIGVNPTYEIRSLIELYPILEKGRG